MVECCVEPAFLLSNNSQEHSNADRKWHIDAQSVINYKTLLQTDGPSPVRHVHLNALKVEARMRAHTLILLRKHIKN